MVATPAVAASTSEPLQTDTAADRPLLAWSSTTPSEPTTAPQLAPTQATIDEPQSEQVVRINVTDSGDARWTIESYFLLTDDDEHAVFDEYADEVTRGQRDVTYDVQQFEPFRQTAQQATDREMSLENADWDDPRIVSPEEAGLDAQSLPETDDDSEIRVGVIAYSFTWTNFAAVDGDRIYFGDAFQADTGVWFSLTDDQRLVIESPSGYALSAEASTSLQWTGPAQFSDDDLQIIFVRSASGTGAGAVPTAAVPDWLLAGVVGLVIAVGVGSYLLARRRPAGELPAPIARLRAHVVTLPGIRQLRARGSDEQPPDASVTPDSDRDQLQSATERGADAAGVGSPAESGTQLEYDEPVDDGIDPELLSDEERVLRLLKRNGGRMKQGSIVSETGWSNAKVSQLLSQMDDDDEIEKLRIGRENLITLPNVDPTEIR
ncbi:hypothetical protein C495_09355 [Natronorubrum sulfidifaciens JCM 14089]|uniref:HTH iclR-type domain-containing protein n=1 Tax=Natronorubrum sulfidifaciens JCM 14089 TaxID=1230460 RepID=L9WA02_9EURY|nr:hypothetical protein C495_09355 [Natronorubrum sulfidifaciens JCM 14089]